MRSRYEGIGFHVVMAASVQSDPPYEMDAQEVIDEVRARVRHHAADVLQHCEVFDLPSVQDHCARALSRVRSLACDPPLKFAATVVVDLLPDDQAAVAVLLAAQRKQALEDTVRRQKAQAIAEELADPATALLHMLQGEKADWSKANEDKAGALAKIFAQYRPPHPQGSEYALVEVVRQFLDSFTEPEPKRMLYELLAGSMRAANRPQQAASVEQLMDLSADPQEVL